MSAEKKSVSFLRAMEEYMYAKQQLRLAEGLIAHDIVKDMPEALAERLEMTETTARAKLLGLLDELFCETT